MIKSFHRNFKGKIKIIRKPRSIDNGIKNLSHVMANFVLNLELYEGEEIMGTKDFVKHYGATTATALQLTQPYYGTGKQLVADSWFGSMKCVSELIKRGLYSLRLVKIAHKDFFRELLGETSLEQDEWVGFSTTKDEVKFKAWRFKDLKAKDFMSTCSSIVPGNPRRTKHSGAIPRPKVFFLCLAFSSTNIHDSKDSRGRGRLFL